MTTRYWLESIGPGFTAKSNLRGVGLREGAKCTAWVSRWEKGEVPVSVGGGWGPGRVSVSPAPLRGLVAEKGPALDRKEREQNCEWCAASKTRRRRLRLPFQPKGNCSLFRLPNPSRAFHRGADARKPPSPALLHTKLSCKSLMSDYGLKACISMRRGSPPNTHGMFLSFCVMTAWTIIHLALKASALKWRNPLKCCMQGFIN